MQEPPSGPTAPGPPAAGGEDCIHVIRRGPDSVFVHWSCTGPRGVEIARELGEDLVWVLRVLDVGERTSERIPVESVTGGYYAAVVPGKTYGFEIAATDGSRWRTVCQTGRVEVPRGRAEAAAAVAGSAFHLDAGARGEEQRPEMRGLDVPGLHLHATPMRLGSSPGVPLDGSRTGP